jgi:gamma-glutamyltranspeptidase/glutathione hydrolase
MRIGKDGSPVLGREKGSKPNPRRQLTGPTSALVVALALAPGIFLGGCTGKPDESKRGTVGFVQGFIGGVAADEPRAALVGREILSAGGSAADAAVATYLALAVTLPSRATLGGGGVCLAHDAAKAVDKSSMLDFAAFASKASAGPGATALPMNARGFFLLHARHGRLKWEQLVTPAVNMARFGVPLPRALARDLAGAGGALAGSGDARRIFGRADGTGLLREGERLAQIDLAAVLDRIRTQGPGYLYVGEGAHKLIEAYRAAGHALDRDELRDTVPTWREAAVLPIEIRGRRALAYVTVAPALAGSAAGRIVAQLADKDRYARAGENERAPMFLDAARRALAEFPAATASADGLSATAIVAADRDGQVVACAVTPHRPFGTGRVAPGTGILIAPPPPPGADGPAGLAAMIVNDRRGDGVLFAAAAGGGMAATAMAQVAARAALEGRLLEDALAEARLSPAGAARDEGNVNALACPGGLREGPQSCALRSDPRGLGLAAMAN